MKRSTLVLALLALVLPALAATPEKQKAAEAAAQKFLALVDAGDYAASYSATAEIFQARLTKQQWVAALTNVRKPLGTLQSRKLLSATYTQKLPGVADGEYVVLQYEAKFVNKPDSVETITPMLEKDGQWRVSGYFIK